MAKISARGAHELLHIRKVSGDLPEFGDYNGGTYAITHRVWRSDGKVLDKYQMKYRDGSYTSASGYKIVRSFDPADTEALARIRALALEQGYEVVTGEKA